MWHIVTTCLIFAMASVKGLNLAALESKLKNGDALSTKPSVHLATLRHLKNGKWIRFCSVYEVSPNYFLTVGHCIKEIENHYGKDEIRIFVGNPTDVNFASFQIRDYIEFALYMSRRRGPKCETASMPHYDLTLLWAKSENNTLSEKATLPMSDNYISSLSGSRIIGWSDQGAEETKSSASQITVDDLDFEMCTAFFEDEKIQNVTHMCGYVVDSNQYADIDDYGSPVINKDNEVIGIVSHVPVLSVRYITFVRIHEVAGLIDVWKLYLKNSSLYKGRKRTKTGKSTYLRL